MSAAIWMSVGELHEAYGSGVLSPVEVVDAHLDRIAAVDPAVHAFITVDAEGARASGRRLERQLREGHQPGELFGTVVAVKDTIPVKGVRFTEGTERHRNRVAAEDALLVQRLKRAGAIIVGKTNTPEYASYVNTCSTVGGTTLNAWDLGVSSGGSSGGSAVAVALGMATVGIGTDHGGSIRLPASLNGVVGIRPTPGLIPVYPSPWVQDPFDVHGPIARTVDDLDAVLAATSGPAPQVPISGAIHPRVAYADDKSVASLEAAVVGASIDLGGTLTVDDSIRTEAEAGIASFESVVGVVHDAFPPILDATSAIPVLRQLRGLIEHSERLSELDQLESPVLRHMLESAHGLRARDIAAAFSARSRAVEAGERFFRSHDLFMLPTTQFAGFGIDEPGPTAVNGVTFGEPWSSLLSTYLISMMGWPAITIPCGWAANGIPVGLQIVGPHGHEVRVLAAANAHMNRFPEFRSRPTDPRP